MRAHRPLNQSVWSQWCWAVDRYVDNVVFIWNDYLIMLNGQEKTYLIMHDLIVKIHVDVHVRKETGLNFKLALTYVLY